MSQSGEVFNRAVWLEAAADPILVEAERQVSVFVETESEQYRLARELESYYWNSGTPYTTIEGPPHLGYDGQRMSFAWDRPKGKYIPSPTDELPFKVEFVPNKRTRYVNDDSQKGRTVHVVSKDIRIVQKDGKQWLARNRKHAISQKFDEVVPVTEDTFTVKQGESTASMRLLSSEEQQAIMQRRKEYDTTQEGYSYREMDDTQYEIALATLALHGISLPPEENKKHPSSNAQDFRFKHAGSYVLMTVYDGSLSVMSWDERLTHEQRHEVWKAYEDEGGVLPTGMQLSIIRNAIDKGVPDWLKEFEDRIVAEIDETDFAYNVFLAAVRDLFERNNFRPFHVTTPHPSWSIPLAIKLLELPYAEVYPIIAPYGPSPNSHGSLDVKRPGVFTTGYPDEGIVSTWALDDSNVLAEK